MIRLSTNITNQKLNTVELDDSITVNIGDALTLDASNEGKATNATSSVAGAGKYILGVVVGFTNARGEVLGNGDVSSQATGTGQGYYAQYVPADSDLDFVFDLSAVSGTTTGSNLPLVYFNLASASELSESSVTNYGTVGQVLSLGVRADNPSQITGRFIQEIIHKTA